MKNRLIAIVFILIAKTVAGQQAHFIASGTIEYEKTVNTYALIKRGEITGKNTEGREPQLYDTYKSANSQFKILKSTLTFSDNKTLFVPDPKTTETGNLFIPAVTQFNTIYTDYTARTVINQKKIFDEPFLLKDSTRHINWKITDETREIAGYTCRRANALVLDSIYVVAFYTESIHVPGGPESFCGLPGMILEVALPHENVTWKAIKVTETIVPAPTSPDQGKPVDRTQLLNVLQDATKGRTLRQVRVISKNYLL